jgi:hypothetical protein
MKIIEKDFNVITGEETITERDETAAEAKNRLDRAAEVALEQAQAEAKAIEKAALLAKLGITADEAALLLS